MLHLAQMLLGSLQKRPQLKSAAELEEEARQLSAQAKTQAMKGRRATEHAAPPLGTLQLERGWCNLAARS